VFEGDAASANVKAATEAATKRATFAVPIDVYLDCGRGYGTNEGSD
jgi:2-oxoglutarate dehydrogenase complex dehydrogenase (E1) component-like enzyme